jgi:hypothetical protein
MLPSGQLLEKQPTELAFLSHQAADARGAMMQTTREIGNNLGRVANAHPVITLVAGALGGALLGRALAGHGHATTQPPSPTEPESLAGSIVGDMARQMIPGLTATLLAIFQPPETTGDPPPFRET